LERTKNAEEGAMARFWTEEMETKYNDYMNSMEAWEVLHEEYGFEDLGAPADKMISDIDGQETHMHFLEESPRFAADNTKDL
jgi:hypothetical protein